MSVKFKNVKCGPSCYVYRVFYKFIKTTEIQKDIFKNSGEEERMKKYIYKITAGW